MLHPGSLALLGSVPLGHRRPGTIDSHQHIRETKQYKARCKAYIKSIHNYNISTTHCITSCQHQSFRREMIQLVLIPSAMTSAWDGRRYLQSPASPAPRLDESESQQASIGGAQWHLTTITPPSQSSHQHTSSHNHHTSSHTDSNDLRSLWILLPWSGVVSLHLQQSPNWRAEPCCWILQRRSSTLTLLNYFMTGGLRNLIEVWMWIRLNKS